MTEPSVVNAAYFHMPSGLRMENVISSTSFTSGNDKNEESHTANNMRPTPPKGRSVSLSQTDIASKIGIDVWVFGGNLQQP
jgi:hypothetical protein